MKKIYLDNAATTKMDERVFKEMVPCFLEDYGNPSGIYADGVKAKRLISDSRKRIADTLSVNEHNIVFTGSGTEADNMALTGIMESNSDRGKHLIVSTIEHHAVLKTAEHLTRNGFDVSYCPVNSDGVVDIDCLVKLIRPDTVLISVMFANNETGVIQPIKEIAKICKDRNLFFHTDAVQMYGKKVIKPKELGIDLLSVSAHKFYGPKGIGFLYIGDNIRISSFVHGGEQERGLRAGTENVPAIVGMGFAAKIAYEELKENIIHESKLIEHLENRIIDEMDGVTVNGQSAERVCNILNVSIDGIEGESLLIMLDMKRVEASTGSACVMSMKEPSHVIMAMKHDIKSARNSIRFSVSKYNTMEEIDTAFEALKESVDYLRKISTI